MVSGVGNCNLDVAFLLLTQVGVYFGEKFQTCRHDHDTVSHPSRFILIPLLNLSNGGYHFDHISAGWDVRKASEREEKNRDDSPKVECVLKLA